MLYPIEPRVQLLLMKPIIKQPKGYGFSSFIQQPRPEKRQFGGDCFKTSFYPKSVKGFEAVVCM